MPIIILDCFIGWQFGFNVWNRREVRVLRNIQPGAWTNLIKGDFHLDLLKQNFLSVYQLVVGRAYIRVGNIVIFSHIVVHGGKTKRKSVVTSPIVESWDLGSFIKMEKCTNQRAEQSWQRLHSSILPSDWSILPSW